MTTMRSKLSTSLYSSSFPMVSKSRVVGDSTSKTTRVSMPWWRSDPAPAIDPNVGTPDLAGLGFDAAVAGERPASASAELVAQVSEHVDDDVVVHVARTRHHAQRKPIHELVAVRLELLPGEKFLRRPAPRGRLGHFGSADAHSRVTAQRLTESPQEALPLAQPSPHGAKSAAGKGTCASLASDIGNHLRHFPDCLK